MKRIAICDLAPASEDLINKLKTIAKSVAGRTIKNPDGTYTQMDSVIYEAIEILTPEVQLRVRGDADEVDSDLHACHSDIPFGFLRRR